MHSLNRLAIAAAATAIASVTALGGAGVAGAQDLDPVSNSPSSVSVSGTGENTKVTYDNKSGHDLRCSAFVGKSGLVGDLYDYLRTTDFSNAGLPLPPELYAAMIEANENGQLGGYGGFVEDGDSTELTPGGGGTVFGGTLTDDSFAPAAVAFCVAVDVTYIEIEVSAGVGVPAGLGSLDAALIGVGSSGSVAQTAGSLGS